ncbi:MAG: lycopene cyclase family protein [Pseudomonadota bacterium]
MSDNGVNTEQAFDAETHSAKTDADVLIVGGSLANCLSALWMAQANPNLLIGLLDFGSSLLENQDWLLLDDCISARQLRRLQPYISKNWHSVATASSSGKTVHSLACSLVSGEKIRSYLEASPRIEVLPKAKVTAVAPTAVEISSDDLVTAPLVLDGRPVRNHRSMSHAHTHHFEFQLTLARPHGLQQPILMDTSQGQLKGFNYMQTVPLSIHNVFVAHVLTDENPGGDVELAKAAVLRHAVSSGWAVADAKLHHQSSEPFLTDLNRDVFTTFARRKAVPMGQAALMSHPTTLDPLVAACRMAEVMLSLENIDTENAMAEVVALMKQTHANHQFHWELNQQIADPSQPEFGSELFNYLSTLPDSLLTRFYSADCRSRDRLRISMVRTGTSLVKAGKAISQLGGAKRAP